VDVERFDQALELLRRIVGPEAAREMNRLVLGGYPSSMGGFVEVVRKKRRQLRP
jgi:hypothetical protein